MPKESKQTKTKPLVFEQVRRGSHAYAKMYTVCYKIEFILALKYYFSQLFNCLLRHAMSEPFGLPIFISCERYNTFPPFLHFSAALAEYFLVFWYNLVYLNFRYCVWNVSPSHLLFPSILLCPTYNIITSGNPNCNNLCLHLFWRLKNTFSSKRVIDSAGWKRQEHYWCS